MEVKNSPLYKVRSFTALALIGWTAIVLSLIWINWNWIQDHIQYLAQAEARASIDKDILYRGWNASHGGVYVPVTETTQPNPYLNIPEREITTPSGRLLTLINPAYMTRQIYELQKTTAIYAHLTSLNPLNPGNKADAWEAQSLQSFESGITETNSVELINGEEYMRLMRPFVAKEDCLKCHAAQGYKVGDIRGGLSVSVPMSKYAGIIKSSAWVIFSGYGTIWIVGLLGIYLASNDLKKRFQEREGMMLAIQKSREEYHTILQTAIDGYWQVDFSGKILDVNDAYCKMCGYSRAELLQMNISNLDVNEKQVDVKRHIENIIINETSRFEVTHRRKDGSLFLVEVSVRHLEKGKLFAFLHDITEQKRAREKLRASEEKFSKIFQFSPAMVTLSSLEDGKYLDVNHKFLNTFGYTRDEVIGNTSAELGVIKKEIREQLKLELLSSGRFTDIEITFRKKNGDEIICLYNGEIIDLEGKTFLLSLAQDITEQKHIERSLRENETLLMKTQRVANLGYYLMDIQSGIWTSSDILDNIFGIEKNHPQNVQGWAEIIHPDEREDMTAYFANEVLRKKQDFDREYRIMRIKDQQVRWVHGLGELQFDAQGNTIRMIGTIQDITEHKLLLLEREQFFKFFQISNDLMVITDSNGCFKRINPTCLHKLGYTEADLLEKPLIDFIHPDDKQSTLDEMAKQIETGYSLNFENRYMCKDGTTRWLSWRATYVKEEGTTYATARDVSEQKRAEASLRASEERFRTLITSSEDVIFTLDTQGRHTGVFGRWLKKRNLKPEFFIGRTSIEVMGEEAGKIHHEANLCAISGKSTVYEWSSIDNNNEKNYYQTSLSPIYDSSENVIGIVGIGHNITEIKNVENELRTHQARLKQAQYLAKLGMWEWNPKTDKTIWSDEMYKIYGITAEEFTGKGLDYIEFTHPEDQGIQQGNIRKDFEKAEQLALQTNQTADTEADPKEFRIIRPDGSICWVQGDAIEYVDEQGKPLRMLGILRDITEQKNSENKIVEKSNELETLFKISTHLRTARTVGEMIPVVLEQMAQTFHSDANALVLLEEDQKYFHCILGDGFFAANTGLQFEVENSISGRIMKTLEPYATLDFANDPRRSPMIKNMENIGAAVIVPLQSEKEFVGTLLCARAKNSQLGAFTEAEVNLLCSIGEMVGNALRRANLYDDALSRLQRVQALRSIDAAINANMDSTATLRVLINQILSLMKVDAAAALTYNPKSHTLEFVTANGFRYKDIENTYKKLNSGFTNTAIVERRLIKIPDLAQSEDPIYKEMALKEGFTSCYIIPMIAKGQVCGLLEVYNRSALNPNQEWLDFLEVLSGQAAIAINNAQLFTNLEKSNLELSLAYDATIEGWSQALDLKDKETEGHTLRVTAWTIELAKLAALSEVEIIHIRRGALLHDIGKMGIPDNILNKAGKLTPDEWKIMRQHTQYAYNMIYPIAFLRPAIDIPYCHHERWDGTGYPRGLKNEQIPYIARLFAIIDVWDAVTSDRPYRKAWTFKKAIEHIKSETGKHFDPQIVDLFIKEIDRFTGNKKDK